MSSKLDKSGSDIELKYSIVISERNQHHIIFLMFINKLP